MTLGAARDALLAEARSEAEALLARADADADATLAAARREAGALLERARAQGAEEGRLRAAREESEARTRARMVVLAARSDAYAELRTRARAMARALREDPEYPALLDRLAAAARAALGDGAAVEADADGAGGVRARAGTRRVELTLDVLADECLARMGPGAGRLWA